MNFVKCIFNLVNSSNLKILCKMCCSQLICDRYSVHIISHQKYVVNLPVCLNYMYRAKKLFMLLLLCTKIKNHLFKKQPGL